MNLLAEISDKIVSPQQMWAVMGIASAVVGLIALASRSWGSLIVAIPMSALACLFTLGWLNDPIFGDAVLRENGWSWFVSNFTASALPVATVVVAVLYRKRAKRHAMQF